MRVVLVFLALAAAAYGNLSLKDPQGLQVFEESESSLAMRPTFPRRVSGVCLTTNLKACQANFNDELGISNLLDWKNPQTLLYLINNMYKKGLDKGLLPLCEARVKFYQCLGSTYDLCIDRRYLVSQGASLADATLYVKIFKQLEFECVGGSIQSTQHWDKIEEVRLSPAYNASVSKCVANFNNATATNHDQTEYCRQGGNLAMCLSINFFDTCGGDCSWWECERVRAAFQIDGYCPLLTCTQSVVPDYNGHHGFYRSRAQLVDEHFGSGSAAARILEKVAGRADVRAKRP